MLAERGEVHIHPADPPSPHSHGFGSHAHRVPGMDGAPLTWRSLLALGISGGLLPCPSALILGLGAIALNRVGYGLVLIFAFSAGLAATLVAVGLAMVYSGRLAGRARLAQRLQSRPGFGWLPRAIRVLPVTSASVVALAGLALTFEALQQIDLPTLWNTSSIFRSLAVNGLPIAIAAIAILFALRRRPVISPSDPVAHDHDEAHGPHGHTHRHGENLHTHPHVHEHTHGHEVLVEPSPESAVAPMPASSTPA